MASDADDDRPGEDESGSAGKPGDEPSATPNPFAGTPLESLFGAMGPGQMPDLQQLMGQVQQLLTPHEGNINWDLAGQVARQTLTKEPDPSVTGGQVKNALSLGLGAQSELFGWSLAARHLFEATGRVDLAIGAPSHDTAPYTATGRVIALEFAANDQPVDPPVVLTQATAGDSYTSAAQFGWSLAAGSMLVPAGSAGHDGYDDLAVGAPNESPRAAASVTAARTCGSACPRMSGPQEPT